MTDKPMYLNVKTKGTIFPCRKHLGVWYDLKKAKSAGRGWFVLFYTRRDGHNGPYPKGVYDHLP